MPDPGGEGFEPGRIVRTLRHLPPGRVLRRLARPLRNRIRRLRYALGSGPGPVTTSAIAGPVVVPPVPDRSWVPPGRFEFLGVGVELGSPRRWTPSPSRLWAYHLHYLDALREDAPVASKLDLLDDWIASSRPGSTPGWESFPTSLRLVNALEFLAAVGPHALAARKESLALQAWWLAGGMERDLGANHLWKNAVALVWAGRCLGGPGPDRWRRLGDELAADELDGQMLADGFHVERSPGYHAILVDDLIRLDRFLRATGEDGTGFGRRVTEARRRAADALASVVHPDGEIPLFNDAAFGQSPPSTWILDRSAELDGGTRPKAHPGGAMAAGFHVLRGDRSVMIFDAGEIGCGEQPGHAHADTLSYELSMSSTRVVVDAGVFDYEPSERRAYARSTRAHNTVELDGRDQSEMWGVFRVGRRAHPRDVHVGAADGPASITAAHDGYAHLSGSPVHRRAVRQLGADRWRVEDRIEGSGAHRASSRIRLHPSFRQTSRDETSLEASDGRTRIRIVVEGAHRLDVEPGRYFPRFGVEQPCLVVRCVVEGSAPLALAYRLELSTSS